jgi:hypothetical protein
MPTFSSVRRTGKADSSTSRMISSFSECFAFARLVAVLVGLAFRHGIVPKNLDGVAPHTR